MTRIEKISFSDKNDNIVLYCYIRPTSLYESFFSKSGTAKEIADVIRRYKGKRILEKYSEDENSLAAFLVLHEMVGENAGFP
jgi:hypothetical protein